MKYCDLCCQEFEAETSICSICGATLVEIPQSETNEYEAAEIVSTMMTTGIL